MRRVGNPVMAPPTTDFSANLVINELAGDGSDTVYCTGKTQNDIGGQTDKDGEDLFVANVGN